MEIINKFRFSNYFLSNFYPRRLIFRGKVYCCAEAAFQSAKSDNEDYKKSLQNVNGGKAKKLGRKVLLRYGWESVKLDVMKEVIHAKFKWDKELAQELIETGDKLLVEGNTWNDTYWGVCNDKGQNNLGKILMQEREYLVNTRVKN